MNSKIYIIILVLSLSLGIQSSFAQVDTSYSLSQKSRRIITFSTQGALALGSLVYLQSAWYSDYSQGSFHTIDDSGQWLQMDKIGHSATANILSNLNYRAYRWSGYNNKQATWAGVGLSWGYLATIEVMDGFSEEWGFSWYDMAANTIGVAIFAAQQLTWEDQRFLIKFSYHPTEFAEMRPEVLGSTASQQILKDYNGQTYWLSVNPQSFSKNHKIFPKWLNLAFGYSGDGMLGGSSNVGEGYDYRDIPRVREFYFSPDIDFTRIKTKSKFVNTLFVVLNIIKVPAPTLEVDQNGKVQFYWFYF
jgi:hypothetical protein